MHNITAADALRLSIAERIVLVEDIWDSIAANADSIELTEEEKGIIDTRLEAHRHNPGTASPWRDVYQRILSKHEV